MNNTLLRQFLCSLLKTQDAEAEVRSFGCDGHDHRDYDYHGHE
jgi:hypothetical protein